jgi:hypothetical protein
MRKLGISKQKVEAIKGCGKDGGCEGMLGLAPCGAASRNDGSNSMSRKFECALRLLRVI